MNKNLLASLLVLVICSANSIFGQELQGIVKSTNGKPLEKVLIRPGYTETDKNGKFSSKSKDLKFVFFTKNGFRPLAKKLKDESEIEVFLESENESDRLRLSACSTKNRGKNVGVNILLFVPKGFKSKKGRDIDYVDFYISSDKDKKNLLRGIWGPNASSGYPDSDWINSSGKIDIRSITDGKRNIGWDFYGKTNNGKNWRYLQVFDESIFYIVDSDEAKITFDKIIDNSCSTIDRYFKD